MLPVVSVTWLRGLLTGIGAGGAPAAVKLTAVAATAGLAVGLPASVELSDPGSKPLHLVVVPTKPAPHAPQHIVHARAPSRAQLTIPTPTPTPTVVTVRIDERHATHRSTGSSSIIVDDRRGGGSGETTTPVARSGGSEGPGGVEPTTTVSSLPPVTTTTSHEGPGDGAVTSPTVTATDGHDGGSGGGLGGRDGGSDGDLSGSSSGNGSGSDGH